MTVKKNDRKKGNGIATHTQSVPATFFATGSSFATTLASAPSYADSGYRTE